VQQQSVPRGWAGIDVGKGHHWVCLIDEAGTTLWSSKVVNDEGAILEAIGEVLTRAEQVLWAVDVTGMISALLLALLAAHGQYGPVASAIMVYLFHGQFLSRGRTADALSELFNTPVSAATVAAVTTRAAAGLDPFLQHVTTALTLAPVLHVDETGLRCQGRLAYTATATKHGLTTLDALTRLTSANPWLPRALTRCASRWSRTCPRLSNTTARTGGDRTCSWASSDSVHRARARS
jgi:hypothetical protein